MIIGVIKEIKNGENRVSLTPAGVVELIQTGHKVKVETMAGAASSFSDEEYKSAGAFICPAKETWDSDFILKVKEPEASEYKFFKKHQIIFTYLHLAVSEKSLTEALINNGCVAIAYETVELKGELILLTPMSIVAGKMAIQVGGQFLSRVHGGRGTLLDGMPGVLPGKVLIIGGGQVGSMAARAATGRGALVTVFDINDQRLHYIEDTIRGKIQTIISNKYTIAKLIKDADLVIGAVLIPGHKSPKVVTEEMIKSMKKGSVVVDVSIDQGGCIETSKPTTHEKPIFEKHGVIHYCVTNMPSAYPRTSTYGLTNATLPYILKIANKKLLKALEEDEGLLKGVNVMDGFITSKPVVEALNMGNKYRHITELL